MLVNRDRDKALLTLRIFFIAWFVVSLLQGLFSGLNEDEPYYYMYAQNPAWGYFDHPPMVAVFIRAGILLLGKWAGLRLFAALASVLFLIVLWQLVTIKDKWRYVNAYILFALSIPMLSIYGFIIVPDGPLMLFAVLFLYFYKRFTEKNDWGSALLTGLTAALMLYSKYHGALLIVLVILSNLRLLANLKFWMAAVLAFLLFAPNVWWQVQNDFPSIRYHLFDRSAAVYKLGYTLEYLPNQLVVFGPFNLVLFVFAAWKVRSAGNAFIRALKFIFWGFLGFFLLMTFKGHAEPHWTVIAIMPGILLSLIFLEQKPGWNKAFVIGNGITAVLLIAARLLLLIPGLPTPYHNQREWAAAIEEKAQDAPVVFLGTYQKPSMYTYLTGKEAFSYNWIHYRRNQYDLWDYEDRMQGKRVYVAPQSDDAVSANPAEDAFLDPYRSYKKLIITTDLPPAIEANEMTVTLDVKNPYGQPLLDALNRGEVEVQAFLYRNGALEVRPAPVMACRKTDADRFKLWVLVSFAGLEGEYTLRFSIFPQGYLPTFNGYAQKIRIDRIR